MFDAQEYLATVEPPKFRAADGTLYTGRVLSVDEFEPIQIKFRDAKQNNKNGIEWRQMRKLLLDIADTFFPRPWWKIWEKRVSHHLKTLPPVGMMKAVWDFMQSQRVALGLERIQQPSPGTPQPEDSSDTDDTADSPTVG